MFCAHCGQEIGDADKLCCYCGRPKDSHVNFQPKPYYPPINPAPTNGMAIAGLICSLFGVFSVLGLIFSIVGLVQSGKHPSHPGRGIAIAGLVVSIFMILFYTFIIAFSVIAVNEFSNSYYSYTYPSYYFD